MRWLTTKTATIYLALLIAVAPVLFYGRAHSANLINRKVTIGSSRASVTTTHDFEFTLITANTLGSIVFEYCSNSPLIDDVCTPPSGFSLAGASLTGETGETGFSIHPSSTNNRLILTRPPVANLASQPVSYSLDGVVNPDDTTATSFVRISTYATDDGSGPRTDYGTVAFAVTPGISVAAFVPPYLTFCVGITVASDCTSASGDFVSLGELSKTSANTATSQFAGATNDYTGYSVTLAGTTMTSGNNIIPSLSSPQFSNPGTSQFGINLVNNSSPNIGSNPSGPGTATPNSGYNLANRFKFDTEVIAQSPFSTNFNVITVSYLVNVSSNQSPGIYSSTLTYIATASF